MPTQPAVLGTMRLGNARLGYLSAAVVTRRRTKVRILIGGAVASVQTAARRVRTAGLTIHDALNDAPNTASLTVQGTAPSAGQDLRIAINLDTPRLLFNGTLQTDDETYTLQPDQLEYPCSAIDDLARLNRRRPFGTWVDVSATTIAQYLIAAFAPGFSSAAVQAALPTVSIIFDGTEEFSACLKRVSAAVGGYFYVEDLVLHLFTTEATEAPDPIDGTGGLLLDDPPITVTRDDSQLRTRVYGKGHGETVTTDVPAGETILPIADAVMFNPSGGQAIAGTTPDGAQSQRLTYSGVQLGTGGSLVGPGAAPSVAPALAAQTGAGLGAGVYKYAYTDVTPSGESLPSPLGSVTTGVINTYLAPPAAMVFSAEGGGSGVTPGVHLYAATFVNAAGETTPGPTVSYTAGPGNPAFSIPIGGAGTTARKIYRTVAGGSVLKFHSTIPNNTAAFWGDGMDDVGLGSPAPSVNTAVNGTTTAQQVTVTGIAIGASPTSSRKLYRTVVNGAQLKLLTTLADNTTTGYVDATADGSLGANAPTADTSGLVQPSGQVNAGSTSILLASAGPFPSAGWAFAANGQLLRYTGITGNTLTGVPASGLGALLTTIVYGSQIRPAPALTGVSGLALAMQKGTPVHLLVQRDDAAAQAALVAIDAAQGRVSTGIVEHMITDDRRGEASLIALCDADLLQFARPIVTVTYDTHDVKSKSGKTVVIDLTTPPIHETLTIQTVDISEIDQYPGVPPRFHVVASSVRFSLEDLLRQLAAGGTGR